MRIVNLASMQSAWRGYEYYKSGNVLSYEKIGEGVYRGRVRGSDNNVYEAVIDVEHPRRTVCNCPFANGRRVVCKHAIALYFAIFPKDAEAYKAQVDKAEEEYYAWLEKRPDRVKKYVCKLSKKELQNDLLDILLNNGGWILDQYIRDHDIDD